ncbi:MAG: fumarylacetoacetate hydrolase family protein [Planctomycetes bacterium]|nr:fumarylacetoacetate hydrolase family protein [Planctomycetota bacterium]
MLAFAPSSSPTTTAPRPGALLPDGSVLDLTHSTCGLPALANALDACDLDGAFLPAATELLADASKLDTLRGTGAVLQRDAVRLHAPVPRPGKILCIGLNYRDHAEEQGAKLPERPLVFSKFSTCVLAPGGTIVIPPGSKETDYEAELGVVIGRRASRVSKDDAMRHVLGYCNFHDVSARDFQFADGQWQRGKACDTFAPFGEFVATTDEIPDPHVLGIRLRLNGKTLQDSNTNQLVFRVPELIEFLSTYITLEPGDVIATGTPPGVGFARKPPIYLQPGDTVEVEIDGLGVLSNAVAAAQS